MYEWLQFICARRVDCGKKLKQSMPWSRGKLQKPKRNSTGHNNCTATLMIYTNEYWEKPITCQTSAIYCVYHFELLTATIITSKVSLVDHRI